MGQPVLDGPVSWDLGSVDPGPVSQKPFPISSPTFEDFQKLEGGGREEGKGSHYGGDWSLRYLLGTS